jgi:outer membrane immunogenic protein
MPKAGFAITGAAAALAGSISMASAADLPVKAPMIAPVVAAYDWSGWYAGVGIGGLWADADTYRFPFFGTTTNPSWEQAIAGVHGGYQWHFKAWQNGGIVVGMEYSGSANLSEYEGDTLCPNPVFTCQARLQNLFTIGGKLGLTWDKFMIYGTGGYAGSTVNTRTNPVAGGIAIENTRAWHNGWYAGGGIDWVFYQTRGTDWIIGAEYQHVELDEVRHFDVANTFGPGTKDIAITADIIKAKLTVKLNGPYWFFGGAAPVVAKY